MQQPGTLGGEERTVIRHRASIRACPLRREEKTRATNYAEARGMGMGQSLLNKTSDLDISIPYDLLCELCI